MKASPPCTATGLPRASDRSKLPQVLDSAEVFTSDLCRASLLSNLVMVDDMRSILGGSQRLLSGIYCGLSKAIQDTTDLLELDPVLQKIERQCLRNKKALLTPAESFSNPTPVEIVEIRIAIAQSQTLVTETLLSNSSHLACERISQQICPGPEFDSLAPILGVKERAEYHLRRHALKSLSSADHVRFSHSLGILVAALSDGLPQSKGLRRQTDLKETLATTREILSTYRPSDALQSLFRRTFEYVYGESGIASTLALVASYWGSFGPEEKTVIANYYAHALWHSFNRNIHNGAQASSPFESPIPVVFDNTLSQAHHIGPHTSTGAFFTGSTSPYSPGPIVINHHLNITQTPIDILGLIGHEMVHACVFHLIREGITPKGCEHDMPWLKASTTLCAVEGTYDLDPHEHIARFGQNLLKTFFDSRNA